MAKSTKWSNSGGWATTYLYRENNQLQLWAAGHEKAIRLRDVNTVSPPKWQTKYESRSGATRDGIAWIPEPSHIMGCYRTDVSRVGEHRGAPTRHFLKKYNVWIPYNRNLTLGIDLLAPVIIEWAGDVLFLRLSELEKFLLEPEKRFKEYNYYVNIEKRYVKNIAGEDAFKSYSLAPNGMKGVDFLWFTDWTSVKTKGLELLSTDSLDSLGEISGFGWKMVGDSLIHCPFLHNGAAAAITDINLIEHIREALADYAEDGYRLYAHRDYYIIEKWFLGEKYEYRVPRSRNGECLSGVMIDFADLIREARKNIRKE